MKIFLGNGPHYRNGYYYVRAGSRWPHFEEDGNQYMPFPFYLSYATAVLEKENHTCLLIDGVAERTSEDDYVNRAIQFQPDMTIIEVSTASLPTDLRQATRIKEACPHTKVVFCGIMVDMYRPEFLDEYPVVDFVMKGEYDFVVLELVKALEANEDGSKVHNLVYRGSDGVVAETKRLDSIGDLDSLPWPSRKHLPMMNYHDCPGGIPAPSLQMWSTRGCPFTCTFCAWPQIMYSDNKYRKRNPVDVVDEIEAMRNEYGFRSFYFDDDTFNIGKKRILSLCEEISRRDLGMPWAAMSRADTSDRETLLEMKRSGLQGIKFGVESGSQELVDNAKKSLDLERVKEACAITRELGIRTHLTFSFGLPGETWETVRKTIDFAKHLDPDTLQFSLMTPFPGSTFYEEMKEKNMLLTDDWSQYDGGTTSVVHTDQLSGQDLEKALKMAYNEWDMHKLIRPLRDFRTFKRVLSQPRQTLHTLGFMAKRHLRRVIHTGA